jgi:membrane protease YdiL (CAAX protease family)
MFEKILLLVKQVRQTALIRLKELFTLLNSRDISIYKYCLIAGLASYIIGNLVGGVILVFFSKIGFYFASPPDESFELFNLIMVIIIIPIIETLILIFIIYISNFITKNKTTLCLISAFIWGLPHGAQSIAWFFAAFTAFFIFATAYITWRKISFYKAFLAACVPHCISNLIAILDSYLF